MTLNKLKIGESCKIIEINADKPLRCRLLDMGLIPNTIVKVIKFAPLGDPMQIFIRGYELTLRLDDAKNIIVEKVEL